MILPGRQRADPLSAEELDAFLARIPDIEALGPTTLIDYFVYLLTVLRGASAISRAEVERCFDLAHLHRPVARVYMARRAERGRGKHPKFVRDTSGYRLERARRVEIEQQLLPVGPGRIETSRTLRELLPKIAAQTERDFLKEAIDCYEVGAYRAAIIMGWLLTLDHMFEYIFRHKLTNFNAALAKNTDKRVRVAIVQ